LCNSADKNQATIAFSFVFAVDVIFVLDYYAYTHTGVSGHILFNWTFAAIVPKPLAIAFALFFCAVSVLPSPMLFANAGAAASDAITNVAAANTAINPRVVWFILYFVRMYYRCQIYLASDN
jgi:hypothetical protein